MPGGEVERDGPLKAHRLLLSRRLNRAVPLHSDLWQVSVLEGTVPVVHSLTRSHVDSVAVTVEETHVTTPFRRGRPIQG